jgi:hypothetical protein
MKKPSFGEKTRYYFENTMSAGPAGVIKWLAIVSLFMVLVLGLVILSFRDHSLSGAGDRKIRIYRRCMAKFNGHIRFGYYGW